MASEGLSGVRRPAPVLALLLAMGFLASSASTGHVAAPPAPRGTVAFRYARMLSAEELAWYGRFDLLVTHDPLPAEQVEALHRAGTRLLFYEWSVAVYATLARERRFEKSLLRESPGAFLNRKGLRGGVGDAALDALYFDPAAPGIAAGRARALAARVSSARYDGVFLDTLTAASVHPEALAEFTSRHPGTAYDDAFSRFLAALRRELGSRLIFTNQGYRAAPSILPFADLDLTESYMVGLEGKSHRRRPWNDPEKPWTSARFVVDALVGPHRRSFPGTRFVHLGYVSEKDPGAVAYAVAAARLLGDEAYVVAPRPAAEASACYFFRPGAPRGPLVDLAGGRAAYRVFENGVVAVNETDRPVQLPPAETGEGPFVDACDGRPVAEGRLVVPAAGRSGPVGRLFARRPR